MELMKVQTVQISFPSDGNNLNGWLRCFMPPETCEKSDIDWSAGKIITLTITASVENLGGIDLVSSWGAILSQAIQSFYEDVENIEYTYFSEEPLRWGGVFLNKKVRFDLQSVRLNSEPARNEAEAKANPEAKEG